MTNAETIKAIKVIKEAMTFGIPALDRYNAEVWDTVIEALEGQKTSKWIVFAVDDMMGRRTGYMRLTCDHCGHRRIIHWGEKPPTFCESCGAKMEV